MIIQPNNNCFKFIFKELPIFTSYLRFLRVLSGFILLALSSPNCQFCNDKKTVNIITTVEKYRCVFSSLENGNAGLET